MSDTVRTDDGSNDDLGRELIRREAARAPWAGEEGLEVLYRQLDDDQARRVAAWAAAQYEGGGPERDHAIEVLIHVACFLPHALSGLHGRLVDDGLVANFIYPYGGQSAVIFASADAATRDRLIAMVADEELRDDALWCLAWIGDEVVRQRFVTWAREGLPSTWYALFAGWVLFGDGDRRFLTVSERCHRLEQGVDPSPVAVMVDGEGSCPWCRTPLALLLDLDLADERLRFLGVRGQWLRVLTCPLCTSYTPIFTEVDLNGGARWSDLNRRPDWLPIGEPLDERVDVRLGLGVARRTPFEAMAYDDRMSQLGGLPSWIQNPEYPVCPRCDSHMCFLGQVDSGNEFPRWEGMIYAFLDLECGIAATCYQQT